MRETGSGTSSKQERLFFSFFRYSFPIFLSTVFFILLRLEGAGQSGRVEVNGRARWIATQAATSFVQADAVVLLETLSVLPPSKRRRERVRVFVVSAKAVRREDRAVRFIELLQWLLFQEKTKGKILRQRERNSGASRSLVIFKSRTSALGGAAAVVADGKIGVGGACESGNSAKS